MAQNRRVLVIKKQLSDLPAKKAKGIDDIGPYFIKLAAPVISESLCHIFNCSIMSCMFPDIWKVARVTALHKKGPKDCLDNYRPISILCTLSKILERHVHKHMYGYLMSNNLLHPSQSGFRTKHSCATTLTNMTEKWLTAFDEGKFVGVILVDLRKAFDSVNHSLLLEKLKLYGCSYDSLHWFSSYLMNRSQYVSLGNVQSDHCDGKCGVPQGSSYCCSYYL
jgi:hypothetical protein